MHESTGSGVTFCYRVPAMLLFDPCHAWHQQHSARVVAVHNHRAENRRFGLLFQRFVCVFCRLLHGVLELFGSDNHALVATCCLYCDSALHSGLRLCDMCGGGCARAPGWGVRFSVRFLLLFFANACPNQLCVWAFLFPGTCSYALVTGQFLKWSCACTFPTQSRQFWL